MAYVNYMNVGKEVLVASLAATGAGAIHFMFLAPQFAGQMLGPVKMSTAVDAILAFVIGIATAMYTSTWGPTRIGGIAATGILGALAILDQFNLLTTAAPATVGVPALPATSTLVPRASYLAPPGVIVNKHGTVPEVAAGTFG